MSAYFVLGVIAALAVVWAATAGAWTARPAAARLWSSAQTGDLDAALAAERATVVARADLAVWCLERADAAPAHVRAQGRAAGRAWCEEARTVAALASVEARLAARSGGLREDLEACVARVLATLCAVAPGAWTARAVRALALAREPAGRFAGIRAGKRRDQHGSDEHLHRFLRGVAL